jgi:hypothetical protein
VRRWGWPTSVLTSFAEIKLKHVIRLTKALWRARVLANRGPKLLGTLPLSLPLALSLSPPPSLPPHTLPLPPTLARARALSFSRYERVEVAGECVSTCPASGLN